MNKVAEFYAEALENNDAKAKLVEILGATRIDEADDAQLEKVGAVAKELGYDFTIEDAKNYLNPADGEISDDDLDEVAGGKNDIGTLNLTCESGVGMTYAK